ncbi:hypothetical protein F5B22DRAFT_381828 [Xylaria bambusicola]|uniref:uncharacterized protein n=1 Tax=Xylaria bambusicola TaxID=326684 RepID=UPI00200758D0|nr:uncharacterized protein F5B22DRAFT_381828 [Xylaria bambusicola]KAI0508736.1 hypothetical protein F5B22DRAFT_381828 [Xylaria bambusicola]
MHAISSLTSIITLLPIALAMPHGRQVVHEFDLTELHGTFPSDGPYGTGPINSSLSIKVTYPDPSSTDGANLTTTCSYAWPASVSPGPIDWTACEDPSVAWRLNNWTSSGNYRVELYQTLTADGAGLDASHQLTVAPGMPSNPNAYLSCLQMGKFTPTVCQINGPLSALPGPVVMYASEEAVRPN